VLCCVNQQSVWCVDQLQPAGGLQGACTRLQVHLVVHMCMAGWVFSVTGATSLDIAFCSLLWHSIFVCLKVVIRSKLIHRCGRVCTRHLHDI